MTQNEQDNRYLAIKARATALRILRTGGNQEEVQRLAELTDVLVERLERTAPNWLREGKDVPR